MKIEWIVKKMKCDGCVKAIAETLLLVDGLNEVTVDLETKSVSFEAKTQFDADTAKKALAKAGYLPDPK